MNCLRKKPSGYICIIIFVHNPHRKGLFSFDILQILTVSANITVIYKKNSGWVLCNYIKQEHFYIEI